LGYKLSIEGDQLHRFAQFAEAQGHDGTLTVELAVAWANSSKRGSDIYRARRLETIRTLAKYCALFEPETQIPAPRLLGPAHRRIEPHIYTAQEIEKLLESAIKIKPRNGLRPATMRCLIGLLFSTGLRISEALHLTCADVDFEEGRLVVRDTKFRKSRYVPLHPSTVVALKDYARFRDRRVPLKYARPTFFLSDDGGPLRYRQALYAFQCIRRQVGWTRGKRPPRLHDLRHTFACNRLLAWYKQGIDVNSVIFLLSVYMGHGKVTDTYWYLTGTPSLMAIAAQRFECFASKEEVRYV
jgi:integrase